MASLKNALKKGTLPLYKMRMRVCVHVYVCVCFLGFFLSSRRSMMMMMTV